MKEKNVKRLTPQKALVFSLLLTLFFTALSGALLRDFGKISISTVNLSTLNGNQVSARIFKPHSATAENPAPAVILTHGLTVNKESYSQYGLELARRGFVVIGCGLPLLPVGVKKHSFGKSWRVLFLSSHVPALRNRCIHRTQQRISLQDRQGTGMANDLFFAAMNMLPALVITFAGYYLYAKDGIKPFIFGSTYTYTYTINAIPVFPIAVILIRRLFKKCNNPYIPGIIAGILLCWLQVSCSFTIHANMYYGPAAAYLP